MPAETHPSYAEDELAPGVVDLLARFGVDSHRIREGLCCLADGDWWTVGELVGATAASRRTIESLLDAAAPHLDERDGRVRIALAYAAVYRQRLRCGRLTGLADPVGHLLPHYSAQVATMRHLIETAPRPLREWDHIPATAETAVRRALLLDARFWLDGAALLYVGDHDLTSLATAFLRREVALTVVDVDERILEYIDNEATRRRLPIRCLFADLRLGLPPSARAGADLVFTDPPYTPEGVGSFLTQGLEGLRDRANSRVVMAYGFGDSVPALGAQVQASVSELRLANEAVLPDFNRYAGGEAVGGSSDLYILRPTERTWNARDASARKLDPNIYSQGPRAVEAGEAGLGEQAAQAVLRIAAPELLVGRWPLSGQPHWDLATWLARPYTGRAQSVAVNLAPGFDADLLRVLLAARVLRVHVVVGNSAAELASAAGQRELDELLAPAYQLRFLRSTPTSRLAVVAADRAEPADDTQAVLRRIYDRAHGKVANTWREGLIAVARARGVELTKNAARALMTETGPQVAREDTTLLELPRHRLRTLHDAVQRSVTALESRSTRP